MVWTHFGESERDVHNLEKKTQQSTVTLASWLRIYVFG